MFNIISQSVARKTQIHTSMRGQRFENKPVLFIAQTASFDIQKMFVRCITLLLVVGFNNHLT